MPFLRNSFEDIRFLFTSDFPRVAEALAEAHVSRLEYFVPKRDFYPIFYLPNSFILLKSAK